MYNLKMIISRPCLEYSAYSKRLHYRPLLYCVCPYRDKYSRERFMRGSWAANISKPRKKYPFPQIEMKLHRLKYVQLNISVGELEFGAAGMDYIGWDKQNAWSKGLKQFWYSKCLLEKIRYSTPTIHLDCNQLL